MRSTLLALIAVTFVAILAWGNPPGAVPVAVGTEPDLDAYADEEAVYVSTNVTGPLHADDVEVYVTTDITEVLYADEVIDVAPVDGVISIDIGTSGFDVEVAELDVATFCFAGTCITFVGNDDGTVTLEANAPIPQGTGCSAHAGCDAGAVNCTADGPNARCECFNQMVPNGQGGVTQMGVSQCWDGTNLVRCEQPRSGEGSCWTVPPTPPATGKGPGKGSQTGTATQVP